MSQKLYKEADQENFSAEPAVTHTFCGMVWAELRDGIDWAETQAESAATFVMEV